jgi:hypothetical protein
MLDINKKKELFVVTLKGNIPKERWNEFINYVPIIRNIEIGNDKSKRKQKRLIQLMTTMGLYIPFSSYYLCGIWSTISVMLSMISQKCHFSTLMKRGYSLNSQLLEERMKANKCKNDGTEYSARTSLMLHIERSG